MFTFHQSKHFLYSRNMSRKRSWKESEPKENPQKTPANWKLGFGLLSSLKDTSLHIFDDDQCTIIKDKYPKSQYHYLVCPKSNINTLRDVNISHLPLLKHMETVAMDFVKKHSGINFLFGYHAVPSMSRLHLHIISDDFHSSALTSKKHWNSFTTAFLLKSADVIKQLENHQKIIFPSAEEVKQLINQPLKCHKCSYNAKFMPDFKKHLATHVK